MCHPSVNVNQKCAKKKRRSKSKLFNWAFGELVSSSFNKYSPCVLGKDGTNTFGLFCLELNAQDKIMSMAKGETPSNSDQAARFVHNLPFIEFSQANAFHAHTAPYFILWSTVPVLMGTCRQAGVSAGNLLTGDAQVLRHCGSAQPFI